MKINRLLRPYANGLVAEENRSLGPFITGSYRGPLSYLVLLYSSCYKLPNIGKEGIGRNRRVLNKATIYCSNMDIILSHVNIHLMGRRIPNSLKRAFSIAALYYPEKVVEIQNSLLEIIDEKENMNRDPEMMAGLYGKLFSKIFVWRNDEFAEDFSGLGQSFGAFSYLSRCYENLRRDEKRNNYNPLLFAKRKDPESFDTYIRQRLLTLCDSCMDSIERLPIRDNEDAIKNAFSQYLASQYLQR